MVINPACDHKALSFSRKWFRDDAIEETQNHEKTIDD